MGNNVNDQGKVKEEAQLLMTLFTKCKICFHLPILIQLVIRKSFKHTKFHFSEFIKMVLIFIRKRYNMQMTYELSVSYRL